MNYCSTTKLRRYELKFSTIMLLVAYFAIFLTLETSEAGTVNGISGTISDGQTITVKGSGFGSSGPNVVVFDDFESGTSGANIKTGTGSAKFGKWDARINSTYYDTAAKLSGTKSFTSNMSGSWSNYIEARLPANTKGVFASWWLFVPAGNNWPGEGLSNGINWKQMWIQGSNTTDDDYYFPVKMETNWVLAGNDPISVAARTYLQIDMQKGSWKRIWGWIKGSASSTSNDGEIKFWELTDNNVTQRVNKTGITTLKTGGAFEKIRPNGYGRATSNCFTSFDDIYIASGPNAQARVEIGNASVYSNSTKLTILTPTSWSDSSISAQVNTGNFKTDESAFLFVFKADGSVSSGYPIKIGATGTTGGSTVTQVPPAPDFRLKQ